MRNNLKIIFAVAGTVTLAMVLLFWVCKFVLPTGATRPTSDGPGHYLATRQLAFAGYATPEAALQSIAWAAINGDGDKVFAAFSPEMQADITKDPNGRSKFNADIKRNAQQLKGMQIVARKMLADDKAELKIKFDINSSAKNRKPAPGFRIQPMVKIGEEWRLGGSTRDYTSDWDNGSQPEPVTS